MTQRRRGTGRTHFNFRILRTNGAPVSGLEAAAVLVYFRQHRAEPPGFQIEATSWGRTTAKGKDYSGEPGDSEQGREAMLNHFWYILHADGLAGLRLGAVDE